MHWRRMTAAGEVVEADGHTWLAPRRRPMAARRAAAVGVVAVVAAAAMPVAEALGLVAALALVVVVVAGSVWLLVRVWRSAHTRVGVGPAGVLHQSGARTRMLGWDAVEGITTDTAVGHRSGGRVTVVVEVAGDGQVHRLALRCRPEEVDQWRRAVASHLPR